MVELPGRFQVLPGRPAVILDVAHNPHAAAALSQNLGNMGFFRYTYAVFGIMQDKDIAEVIAAMNGQVDHWCVAQLDSPRSADPAALVRQLEAAFPAGANPDDHSALAFPDPGAAYANALSRATENDRIVVFGSFYTVAGVMAARKNPQH
jgi:dihydrofolate synthase/folylpolyglutamate synthase